GRVAKVEPCERYEPRRRLSSSDHVVQVEGVATSCAGRNTEARKQLAENLLHRVCVAFVTDDDDRDLTRSDDRRLHGNRARGRLGGGGGRTESCDRRREHRRVRPQPWHAACRARTPHALCCTRGGATAVNGSIWT